MDDYEPQNQLMRQHEVVLLVWLESEPVSTHCETYLLTQDQEILDRQRGSPCLPCSTPNYESAGIGAHPAKNGLEATIAFSPVPR